MYEVIGWLGHFLVIATGMLCISASVLLLKDGYRLFSAVAYTGGALAVVTALISIIIHILEVW